MSLCNLLRPHPSVMKHSHLCPPTNHLLSDNIVITAGDMSATPSSVYQERLNPSTSFPQAAFSPQQSESTVAKVTQSLSIPTKSRGRNTARVELNAAEKTLQHFRDQRRATQQRYRNRINYKLVALENEVTMLQEELRRIQLLLNPPPHVASDTFPWKAVAEFFRLFQHGVDEPVEEEPGSITVLDTKYGIQKRFLHVIMAPTVAFNDGCGVDAVMKHWSFYSNQHEKAELRLVRLEQDSPNAVVAYLSNSTTITANMLRKSGLIADEGDEASEWPIFASKLLGHRLTFQIIVRFVWDNENNCFESAFYQADMMTPLVKVLGNIQDASTFLSSTLGFY